MLMSVMQLSTEELLVQYDARNAYYPGFSGGSAEFLVITHQIILRQELLRRLKGFSEIRSCVSCKHNSQTADPACHGCYDFEGTWDNWESVG